MPQVKAAKSIIPANSKQLPKDLSSALKKKSQIESEDCPWVKIGNVYVSISVTGDNSWLPVARLLYDTEGKRKFTVFTGRHGDYLNPYREGECQVFDSTHFTQDKDRAKEVAEYLPEIKIKVLDTSGHPRDQSKWLKDETLKELKAGSIVIYAWCYSLFTYSEIGVDALIAPKVPGTGKKVMASHMAAVKAQNVAQVVTDWFHWVPGR